MKKIFYSLFFLIVFCLFTYKLTKVPPGINLDESTIGYNASLIQRTLRDENKRFLPVFILTIDGKDWKNPVNIYSTAIVFKVLGRSYFNLKLVSVIYAIFSAFLFWKLLRIFFSEKLSFIGCLLFLSSPSILLQSHLASDNISGLPFFLLWLYFLFSYLAKQQNPWKIILSGIFLGIAFYSYKGMRAMVPPYIGLTIIFLGYFEFFLKKNLKIVPYFLLGVVPFLLPIPWLQTHYPAAVFDPNSLAKPTFFDASYAYLSTFDFSFLFVLGDKMLIHSTGRYGMFLVPMIVLFFLGLFQMIEEKKPSFYFIFAVLIFSPVFLTLTGSVYRASRLMTLIPTITFLCVLGIKKILELKVKFFRYAVFTATVIALIVSYIGFVKYYFNDYPKRIVSDFSPNLDGGFKKLDSWSKKLNKKPYIDSNDYNHYRLDINFFEQVYFPEGELNIWPRGIDPFPDDGVLISGINGGDNLLTLEEVESIESGQKSFFILGNQ